MGRQGSEATNLHARQGKALHSGAEAYMHRAGKQALLHMTGTHSTLQKMMMVTTALRAFWHSWGHWHSPECPPLSGFLCPAHSSARSRLTSTLSHRFPCHSDGHLSGQCINSAVHDEDGQAYACLQYASWP